MTGHGAGGVGSAAPANGKPVPTPAKLQIMGLAYMHAWLADDYWTIAQIVLALEECGATMQQVAESFSLAAASVLTDACVGSSSHAALLAAAKAHAHAARYARASR